MKTGAAVSLLLHIFFCFLIFASVPHREMAGHGGGLALSFISAGLGEAEGESEGNLHAEGTAEHGKEVGREHPLLESFPAQETGEERKAEETSPAICPEEHIPLQKRAEKSAGKKQKPSLKAQHTSSNKSAPAKSDLFRKEGIGKEATAGKAPAGAGNDPFGKGGGSPLGEAGAGAGGTADIAFGSENGPSFLHFVRPEYPLRARRMGLSGVVRLLVTLNEGGTAVHIEIMGNPPAILAEAAVESIRRSAFRPYRKEGKAIFCRTVIPVRFVLE